MSYYFFMHARLNFERGARLALAGTIQFAASLQAAREQLAPDFPALAVPQSRPLSPGEPTSAHYGADPHPLGRVHTSGEWAITRWIPDVAVVVYTGCSRFPTMPGTFPPPGSRGKRGTAYPRPVYPFLISQSCIFPPGIFPANVDTPMMPLFCACQRSRRAARCHPMSLHLRNIA